MKRFAKTVSSILLLLCLLMSLAMPAMAADKLVIPKMMWGSDGTKVTYALNGTTLTIEETEEKPDYDSFPVEYHSVPVLYPFLNTFTPNDRNVLLTLTEDDPMILFSQSNLVRSQRIQTVIFNSNVYKYTVEAGKVTKITLNEDSDFKLEIPLDYKDGKYAGYNFDDNDGWIYVNKADYDRIGLKSGFFQVPEGVAYDFKCKLKEGDIYQVTKSGGTSYGSYNETDLFSFEGGQLKQTTRKFYDGYEQIHRIERCYYNPDGTLNSIDFHDVDEQFDSETQKVDQTDITDGYYSFVY